MANDIPIPLLPDRFDAWFQRACSHDRDKRFQTVSLALEALRQAPLQARPQRLRGQGDR